MLNGFFGRSIDTKHITPTLRELGFPSMAESGWLTRSLEQPYPYDENYNGKISGKGVKESFLKIIDKVQVNDFSAELILKNLILKVDCMQRHSLFSIIQKNMLILKKSFYKILVCKL